MHCQQPLPPKPHGSSIGETEAGLSTGAGSCQHPLPSPEHCFTMDIKSCFPHKQSLNRTIFSQTAPRLERETWQLPVGREERTPLTMLAALSPKESRFLFCNHLLCKGWNRGDFSLQAGNALGARNGAFSAGPGSDKPTSKHIFCINKTVCLAS